MREVVRIANWRRQTRGGKRYHPTNMGFWPLAARLLVSRPPARSNGDFVAIILTHRRPANLDMQVRAALHVPSIGEVVVSCNNPEVRLRDWLSVESPRLRVLEETGRNQTRRYALALDSGGERFVLPDDDVLYTPDALDEFCRRLPSDASHPIGMAGQRLNASGIWESAITDPGEEVDVLNRAYACTRAHAEGVFRNAELLGWSEEETFSNPADDVLVSFAGDSCPTVERLEHVNCISHADEAISTYKQHNFHPARAEWVDVLRSKLDRPAARRDAATKGALPPVTSSAERIVNVATRPLRKRFYMGANIRSLSLLPRGVRHLAGLDDYRAMFSHRVQIGMGPAPLNGFLHFGDDRSTPDLTTCAPLWAPNFNRVFASDVVAFDVLDTMPPAVVPMALASWRSMMGAGARLIVGVADSSAVLRERDEAVGQRSWASQLPHADKPMTSPLQLVDAPLTGTLWDVPRIQDALTAQGFDVVATITDGREIETAEGVAPWVVPLSRGREEELLPVPSLLDGAADIIVVARAR